MRGGREEKNGGSKKNHKIWLVLLVMLLAAGALAIPLFVHPEEGSSDEIVTGGENGQGDVLEEQPLEPIELTIACVGDIMAHQTQITAAYDNSTGTYDFADNYIYVKDYIESVDLALCNVETTFAGGKPTGYPSFNSPDSMAEDIKSVGFDVAITANNHMLDRKYRGMQRTIDVLRNAGLITVGSHKEGETTFTLVDVEGVRVGIVAYTYETGGSGSNRTMNGSAMSVASKEKINSFSYTVLDQDLAYLKKDIDDARAAGADVIIAYLHWGEEYQRSANRWQKQIAETVADFGADIIFASHPHVLQPVTWLDDVPVFYSMGNFVSNQRAETLDNRYTEQGMIANVTLTWDQERGIISDIAMDVLPTWVDRYPVGGKQAYYIIPLDRDLDQNPTLAVSGHLQRAKQALDDVKSLVGEEFLNLRCFPDDTI